MNSIRINEQDNVALCVEKIGKADSVMGVKAESDIPFGHKIALCDIKKGENIIKYGNPIGHASADIKKGEWVHSHNLETNLDGVRDYVYEPAEIPEEANRKEGFFEGYVRPDGSVGIRNEIWILPTAGCVNKTAEIIAKKANELYGGMCDGVFAYTHPYGCSQLGDDMKYTQKILGGLARHPNASGVLLLSLGCENNNLSEFMPTLGDYDKKRIRTLVSQNEEDEISAALSIIKELCENASKEKREKVSLSKLTIGFKCGGSDAFSGVTANPLCGRITEKFVSFGGRVILTEVPEMFGAETILFNRAKSRNVFDSAVKMINGFKEYFQRHGQAVYENPSPGNKAGGITTLEEKSLGCIQKGGNAQVSAVLDYGEICRESGLNLLTGPGNDMVSATNLTAAGAHIILFTTGRGTPLGAPVPTLKISSNTPLYEKKKNWIDFDAGAALSGESFDSLCDSLTEKIIAVASGEKTLNEVNGYREIAIFKDGVTL